ncbi:hypothetical protein [Rhodobium gokarnense]|uniref:Uncharacterized protein n=1 Tax=Rhodobium gokarnense TaxID=364296 RepID=A0ABT3HCQ3_9HYPH|nr:hypothetical protein [Rhodobium gokarnense]MCW2308155.1 hypothetical protein [Rhodobium gokarnense]
MALAAIVAVVAIQTLMPERNGPTAPQPKSQQVERAEQHELQNLVAAIREFRPWQDSYAQWTMAVFGILATAVSALAVWLVNNTLAETRKATRAAEEAVAATREMGEAQVRAYLTTDGGRIRSGAVKGHLAFKIEITLKNSGQSPAFGIRVSARISASNASVVLPFDVFAHCKIIGAGESEAAESQDYIFKGRPWPPEFGSDGTLSVLGTIHWRDVVGGKHETEFELRQKNGGWMNADKGIIDYEMLGASTVMRINGRDTRRASNHRKR